MTADILVVDDDPVQLRLVEAQVTRMGHRARTADGGARALDILRGASGRDIAAVVLDLSMPDVGGLDVLAALRRDGREVPVVVQTARGGVETVVEAMRAGAFDFVVKPVSPEKLRATIGHALKLSAAKRPARERAGSGAPGSLDGTPSPAMASAITVARRAAGSTIPVLIEGETGVGKEWLASAIRAAGPRAKAPFVAVNCGALPAQLVESILFGHEKGAFTDATERRTGRFLEASGGTLFLDEIGELPPEAQVKLLRVLQTGEIDPVGARAPVRADVRILSATNRDLAADVRSGRFREDLYYRLNVLSIRIPPLRERRLEIDGLAANLLKRFASLEGVDPVPRLSAEARRLLLAYDWPGNIRQLENVLHRATVVAEGPVLQPADFPQILPFVDIGRSDDSGWNEPAPPAEPLPPEAQGEAELSVFDAAGDLRPLEAVEADIIRLAMRRYDGRMSEIARRLGIGRSTLYRKVRDYGIDVDPDTDREAETGRESPSSLAPS
ncbi:MULTISPECIES: sigma-54-dependent transcriptional regulator [unclassified Aureimonas]|uniref:sigma-54-dependent transcriptional regulator n=1 Tax=unclassified Aureimonas TaxID=2615206 RepID=UPI0006F82959|nr:MULTISPECIES: sigma-54 dependent transcriptional regulator [unclassified Aureimonas]KQT52131.1 Fis family transcriptional regulator [Aureimonas sp. Leaf427]KQT70635.1 Fis family transcriptional regulator [Aureimonas sp. Leaf460]